MSADMTMAERRYRRALRWYPKAWRDRHEVVVLATLLDIAEAQGRTAPEWGELMSLALNGMATRTAIVLPAAIRDLISAVTLGAGAVLAAVFFVAFSWAPWATSGVYLMADFRTFGPFVNPGILVYALWIIALVLAVAGRFTAVRVVMVGAVVVPLLLRGANAMLGEVWFGPMATTLGFFSLLALGVLLGIPRRLSYVATATGATGLAVGASLVANHFGQFASLRYVDERSFWMTVTTSPIPMLVLAALALAIVLGIARRPAAAAVTLALAGVWQFMWAVAVFRSSPEWLLVVAVVLVLGGGLTFAGRLAIRRSREALAREASRM